ncbi:MAG: outer membrane beta-barrel protein [Bacteroidales bacterium]|nr:outer membrane beta-barrel protein [Bacteroidales bacterium]
MKKTTVIITVAIVLMAAMVVQGQDTEFRRNLETKVNLFTDVWQDTPDVLDASTINRGVNIYGMYNFPIKNSALDFQIGAGIGIHNLYHNNTLDQDADGKTVMGAIPDTLANGGSTNVENAKFSFGYLDVPMEMHITTQSNLRAAIGFKVGLLINSLSKYKGDDFSSASGDQIKVKRKNLSNTNQLRYGPTLRLGYKWIDLFAYYSLTPVFEENKGPEMYPISIGISVVKF